MQDFIKDSVRHKMMTTKWFWKKTISQETSLSVKNSDILFMEVLLFKMNDKSSISVVK